jgi:hypothetical protein
VSASDLAAVVVSIVCLVLVAVVAVVLVELRVVLRELRRTLERVETSLVPAAADAADAARHTGRDVARIERLLDRSDLAVGRADAASKLAAAAVSKPVIRAMAVGAGTSEAVRRLRRKG